ncbi:MAG: tRNA pseudouridine(55) synthase TruB [Bacteroidales bacterium]|nr:tRNA pseudouridine(55) synthase TruB [Bacteroidales bacterium]
MGDKPGAIIAIDKPVGWTSFQVVNKIKWHIRRTFGIKKIKIGHAGTLDPLASGLLLICLGGATKMIEQLQSGTKVYSGTMVLGATTPCFDLERPIDHFFPSDHITAQAIEKSRIAFTGTFLQYPPAFSAVKVEGQRAYEEARSGIEVKTTPKMVTVYEFSVTDFRPGQHDGTALEKDWQYEQAGDTRELYRKPMGKVPVGLPQLDFTITCSKGTYIRSIARDFGTSLHSGAFLSALRRTRIGEYTIDQAITPDNIETEINTANPQYGFLMASTQQ